MFSLYLHLTPWETKNLMSVMFDISGLMTLKAVWQHNEKYLYCVSTVLWLVKFFWKSVKFNLCHSIADFILWAKHLFFQCSQVYLIPKFVFHCVVWSNNGYRGEKNQTVIFLSKLPGAEHLGTFFFWGGGGWKKYNQWVMQRGKCSNVWLLYLLWFLYLISTFMDYLVLKPSL